LLGTKAIDQSGRQPGADRRVQSDNRADRSEHDVWVRRL